MRAVNRTGEGGTGNAGRPTLLEHHRAQLTRLRQIGKAWKPGTAQTDADIAYLARKASVLTETSKLPRPSDAEGILKLEETATRAVRAASALMKRSNVLIGTTVAELGIQVQAAVRDGDHSTVLRQRTRLLQRLANLVRFAKPLAGQFQRRLLEGVLRDEAVVAPIYSQWAKQVETDPALGEQYRGAVRSVREAAEDMLR